MEIITRDEGHNTINGKSPNFQKYVTIINLNATELTIEPHIYI